MIQKQTIYTFCFIEKPASEEETSLSTGYLWYLAVLGVVRVPHANADDVRRPTSCRHHVGSLPALLGLVVPAPWCAAPMVVGAIVGLSSAPVRGWRPPVPPGGIATSRRACHATTRRARFGTDRRRPSKHHARSIHARLLHLTTILVLKEMVSQHEGRDQLVTRCRPRACCWRRWDDHRPAGSPRPSHTYVSCTVRLQSDGRKCHNHRPKIIGPPTGPSARGAPRLFARIRARERIKSKAFAFIFPRPSMPRQRRPRRWHATTSHRNSEGKALLLRPYGAIKPAVDAQEHQCGDGAAPPRHQQTCNGHGTSAIIS